MWGVLSWFVLRPDAILQPVFQDNLALGLIDEILVQIGLLKVCVCVKSIIMDVLSLSSQRINLLSQQQRSKVHPKHLYMWLNPVILQK